MEAADLLLLDTDQLGGRLKKALNRACTLPNSEVTTRIQGTSES
jgi:hypothetical protein